jgi:hypothetical protein
MNSKKCFNFSISGKNCLFQDKNTPCGEDISSSSQGERGFLASRVDLSRPIGLGVRESTCSAAQETMRYFFYCYFAVWYSNYHKFYELLCNCITGTLNERCRLNVFCVVI